MYTHIYTKTYMDAPTGRVTGQNGSGQNGTDKMVYGQNGIGQNGTDKMVWTKWYNFIFCVPFNSVEFNVYLVTKSHK